MTNLLSRIYDFANGAITADVDNASTKTDALETGQTTVADSYRTARSDSELDTVISNSSQNDHVKLSNSTFSDARTISKELTLSGTHQSGTRIQADYTLSDRIMITQVVVDGSTLTFDARFCRLHRSQGADGPSIQVNANEGMITECVGYDVTFASGTDDGIVDSSSRMTVTDNGTNTVGDLS
jgi:hypothetical protein